MAAPKSSDILASPFTYKPPWRSSGIPKSIDYSPTPKILTPPYHASDWKSGDTNIYAHNLNTVHAWKAPGDTLPSFDEGSPVQLVGEIEVITPPGYMTSFTLNLLAGITTAIGGYADPGILPSTPIRDGAYGDLGYIVSSFRVELHYEDGTTTHGAETLPSFYVAFFGDGTIVGDLWADTWVFPLSPYSWTVDPGITTPNVTFTLPLFPQRYYIWTRTIPPFLGFPSFGHTDPRWPQNFNPHHSDDSAYPGAYDWHVTTETLCTIHCSAPTVPPNFAVPKSSDYVGV